MPTDEIPLTKICTKCGVEKPLEEFCLDNSRKDGRSSRCKKCKNELQNERRRNNPELREKHNKRRREKLLSESNEDRQKRLDGLHKYHEENRDKINEAQRNKYHTDEKFREKTILETRAYYAEHREEQIEKATIRKKERIKRDLNFKIKSYLRSRLGRAIKTRTKVGSFVRDLGCSIDELKSHLKLKFKDGMTGENWGRGCGKWNIDHIIPLAAFDLTNREQFLVACNYKNLQPLWYEDNQLKGSKYEGEIPCLP